MWIAPDLGGPCPARDFLNRKYAEQELDRLRGAMIVMSAEQWAEFHAKMKDETKRNRAMADFMFTGDKNRDLGDPENWRTRIAGQEVSSADVRLSTGTKTIQFHGLDPVTKRAIVMPLVDLVFNVDATAEQVETAKSAIAHLIGIGVDVPKTAPSVVPVDIQDGSLGDAACRAMPARDWHTREVLQKIPMEDWGTVAQAVINKYWELSAVPGQPAG